MAVKKIVGDAWVELHGKTDKLRKDIEELFKFDSAMERKITDNLQKSLDNAFENVDLSKHSKFTIEAELNSDQVLNELSVIEEMISDLDTVDLKVKVDDSALDEINAMRELISEEVTIIPVLEQERAEEVEDDLDEVAKDRSADVAPDYNTAAGEYTSARLAWLTRPRTVDVHVRLTKGAEEAIRALSGYRMLESTFDSLWKIVGQLDKSVPKIMLMGSGIAFVVGGITALIGNVSSLLYDTGRMSALVLPLPGIFAGMALGIGTSVAALKDFNTVLPFVKEDMADLQDVISDAFWEVEKGEPRIANLFRYLSETTTPLFEELGGILGSFFGKLAKDVQDIFTPEVFERLFADLNESIFISAEFTEYWVNAFRILFELGSSYLPRLAEWVGNIGKQFESWLLAKEASGELYEWIEGGIQAAQEFWVVLKNAGGILKDLGDIAEDAGTTSLASFGTYLGDIRDIINSEPFRSILVRTFESAHSMFGTINEISGPALKQTFMSLGVTFSDVFDIMGTTLGEFFEALNTALVSPAVRQGLLDLFDGISEGVGAFTSRMPEISKGVGALLTIMGDLVAAFGPVLAEALAKAADLLIMFRDPIYGAVEILSSLVEIVLKLPAPFLLAAGALIKFYAPLSLVFNALSTMRSVGITAFATNLLTVRTNATIAAASTGGLAAQIAAVNASIGTSRLAMFIQGLTGMTRTAQISAVAMRGLSLAIRGVLIATGVGLAIAALTWAIEKFINRGKEAEAVANSYKMGVEGIEGVLNDFGTETFVNSLADAFGPERLSELDQFGLGVDDMMRGVGNGVEGARSYLEQLQQELVTLTTVSEESQNTMTDAEHKAAAARIAAIRDVVPVLEKQITGMEEAARVAEIDKEAQIAAARARGELVDALGRTEDALKEETRTRKENIDSYLGHRAALRDVEDDLDRLIETQNRSVDTAEDQERKTRDIEAALDDYARSLQDVIYSTAEQTDNASDVIDLYKDQQQALRDTGEATEEYIQKVLDIPEEVVIEYLARDNVSDVTAEIGDQVVSIDGATGTVFIDGDIGSWEDLKDNVESYLRETHNIEIEFDGNTVLEDVGTVYSALREKGIDVPFEVLNIESEEARLMAMISLLEGDTIAIPTALAEVDTSALRGAEVKVNELAEPIVIEAGMEITSDAQGNIATIRGINGEVYTTTLQTVTDAAQEKVDAVRDTAETPANMTLGLDTDDAYLKYAAMKADIRGDVATIDINAETDMAQAVFDGFKGQIRGAVATLDINAETDMADAVLASFKARHAAVVQLNIAARIELAESALTRIKTQVEKTEPDIKIGGVTRNAEESLRILVNNVAGSRPSITVIANTGSAWSSWISLRDSINGKVLTTYVRTVSLSADGNLFPSIKSFASGGLENHIAQIAQPSSMLRVWAEPETGGEAYIPLALSKRSRSLEILEEVARLFGFMLIPQMKKFAEGGILTSVPATSSSISSPTRMRTTNEAGTYYITVEINPSDLDGIRSIEQFVQTVRRRTRQGIG